MRKRIQQKIESLRREPHHVRARVAFMMTAISGVIIVLLWMFLLLPIQLRVREGSPPSVQGVIASPSATPEPSIPVAIPTSIPSPTPSPTPDPQSSLPVSEQVITPSASPDVE